MIIVQLDPEHHRTVGGRVAQIIRWLVEHEVEIERPQKMTLTFDCCGESVTPEVKIRHSALKKRV